MLHNNGIPRETKQNIFLILRIMYLLYSMAREGGNTCTNTCSQYLPFKTHERLTERAF